MPALSRSEMNEGLDPALPPMRVKDVATATHGKFRVRPSNTERPFLSATLQFADKKLATVAELRRDCGEYDFAFSIRHLRTSPDSLGRCSPAEMNGILPPIVNGGKILASAMVCAA